MCITNETNSRRQTLPVSGQQSSENRGVARQAVFAGNRSGSATAYLERFGFDQGRYRQTALNFNYARTQTARNEFPKPPVSNRYTANPGTYGSRNGTDIDAIMLHHTAGSTASGAAQALNSRGLSAHYVIDKDGTIYQMVGDERRAFHAGGGSIRGDGRDVNDRSIGIEIVNLGNGTDPYTEAQYRALERLIPYLTNRYDIPTRNIVGHSETGNPNRPASRPEPSRNFDWERIRRAANGDGNSPESNPTNPTPTNPTNPSPNVSAPTAYLERGDHNAQVKKLQDAMVRLGYMSRSEIGGGYGNFGPRTERAVRAFQREHNDSNGRPLAVDGIYGPKTRGALERALQRGGNDDNQVTAPTAFLNRGDNNSQVKRLQDALVELGYMRRGEIGNGYGNFGPKTERAVREFQQDHRDANGRPLVVDGIYGPKTRGALERALRGETSPVNPTPPNNGANNGNRVPSGRPAEGRITSDFGPRDAPGPGASTNHRGIDIGAPAGARVQSTAPGRVVFAGALGTAGNAVIIDHGNGYQTKFFHLSQINVRVGQRVGDNHKIGEVGNTGNSFGAHLHYEVLRNGTHLDPERFL